MSRVDGNIYKDALGKYSGNLALMLDKLPWQQVILRHYSLSYTYQGLGAEFAQVQNNFSY